jgi:hypothetical protein
VFKTSKVLCLCFGINTVFALCDAYVCQQKNGGLAVNPDFDKFLGHIAECSLVTFRVFVGIKQMNVEKV